MVKELKTRIEKCRYTISHKKAFLKIEKYLLGFNTISGYLHDIEKIPLYLLLGVDKTAELHIKHSRHHDKAYTRFDRVQQVIDWECARFTKKDKLLNAYDTLNTYYKDEPYYNDIMKLLVYYKLNHKTDSSDVIIDRYVR